jgi:hypothetical protein
VKSSTPYPINLSVGKLQIFLDACEPMDPDVFNMYGCILASNALERSKGQRKTIRKHYMDLEFNVCHCMFLLHNFVCYYIVIILS